MYPVEFGIVTVCHGDRGGTGDVAMLPVSNRIGLVPSFALISASFTGAAMMKITH
jgi:Na+/citrate or Na+/malate symporter